MYVLYLGANGTLKRPLELINASTPAALALHGANSYFGRRARSCETTGTVGLCGESCRSSWTSVPSVHRLIRVCVRARGLVYVCAQLHPHHEHSALSRISAAPDADSAPCAVKRSF